MDRSAGSQALVKAGAYSPTQPDAQSAQVQLFAGLVVAIFAAAGALYISSLILADPDTLWHIKTGSDIWKDFKLPVADSYSFTFLGQRWIAKEWLAQLVLFASHAAGGWNGIVVLSAISVGATAFLFCYETGRAANPRIAIIFTVAAMLLASPVFVGRPHILVLPLAVAWTASLFRAAEGQRPPSLLLLAILVAWTNLHGSFLLGIVIAGFAFLHFVEMNGFGERALLWRWVGFLVCCLPASFMHPYGVEPFILAVKLSSGNEWIPLISEWLPFNAKDRPINEIGLLASLAVLLWMRPKLSLSKIAFLLFALHMFLQHQRFVFVYMLLVPMAIARDLVPQDSRLSRATWAAEPRDAVERLAVSQWRALVAVLALVAILLPFAILRSSTEPPANVFVGKAIRFAQDNNLVQSNVLNDYNYGGSLIFHGIPTFVDGRTDQLYLGEFAKNLAETDTPGGSDALIRQLDSYHIGWTLFRKADSRNLVLGRLPQWRRVYSDDQVVIYRRLAAAANMPDKSTVATPEIQ